MKKQYKSPKIKLLDIEAEQPIAASPFIPVIPGSGVTPGEAEAKRFTSLIIDDEEEYEECDE